MRAFSTPVGRSHVKLRPRTALTTAAGVIGVTRIAVAPTTLLVLIALLVSLLLVAGCFLRWYVNLAPRRRADVLALIRAMLGR